jgi:myo-inositol-1(or 4)-monophosphatase
LPRTLRTLAKLMPRCAGVRRFGAAALDLAYVAAGRLDGFWEYGLKPWDVAAGIVLVREAGGQLGTLEEGELMGGGTIVAANPQVYPRLHGLIAG